MEQNFSNVNRISNGTKIIGNIEAQGDLRIDGHVEGIITVTSKVVVGDTGYIKGDLTTDTLDMMGTLDGKIIAADTTSLKPTAKIDGSLKTGKLVVESGAKFNGTCIMGK